MKTYKYKLLTIIMALLFGLPVFGLGQDSVELNKTINISLVASFSNDSIAVYICSMHPEIQADMPGYCPKCGMKLVLKTSTINSNNDSQKKMDMMMCMPMDDMDHSKEKTHPNTMLIVMGSMMAAMMVIMLFIVGSH